MGAGKSGNGGKCMRSMRLSKSWGGKTQRVFGGMMRKVVDRRKKDP